MKHSDIAALMKGAAPAIRDFVASSLQPLTERIAVLERQLEAERAKNPVDLVAEAVADALATRPLPRDGADADPLVIRQMVAEAVGALPPAKDGKSVTLADVQPLIESAVATAVAEIPTPKDGEPVDPAVVADLVKSSVGEAVAALPVPAAGKDADPEAVREMIVEAVASLPRPKDGEPGKDVDPGALEAMIADRVAAAVEALPAPEPGKDAEPAEVARLVDETVERALAGWERPKDGESVTVDDVAPLIERVVEEAVSRIPAPGPGKDGAPGKLPIVKEWTDEVHYESHVVVHQGATYQALRDTAKEPPHDDWLCLAAAGVNGADGRSFRFRDVWSEAGDYSELDVVALNGASFVALRDNPGTCPGEGWKLLAAQGKRGNPGEKASPGVKGDRGLPGPPLVAVDIDDEGLLTLTNGDGSMVACDLYPILSRVASAGIG